jgi:NAD(P)-dependent dehydrogenase (short-subunit alcohol dehydrogenase family)
MSEEIPRRLAGRVAAVTGASRGIGPGIAFYGVSKAPVNHLTVGLAAELGPGVRVAARHPLGRLGEPDDVAASDASWITGQTLVLDGGVTMAGRRA